MWENTTPSTELPRDFCAGIRPLQLGFVLVFFFKKINVTRLGETFLDGLTNSQIAIQPCQAVSYV